MYKVISSTQNTLVKQLNTLLEKSRERKKQGVFIIEGVREIRLALEGQYTLQKLLFCPEIYTDDISLLASEGIEIIQISEDVYQKLAYRRTTEGVLALAEIKEHSIRSVVFDTKKPLILVAEAIEKPGNIGALLRTADAARVDAVFIANPKTDIYNPNIIRSSVGCLFTNQVVVGTNEELSEFLTQQQIHIYSATLQDSTPYHSCDFTNASAIVVGTEATGLTAIWREKSKQNINIPMQGVIDSMNVSVAAGILIFEAKRQRGF